MIYSSPVDPARSLIDLDLRDREPWEDILEFFGFYLWEPDDLPLELCLPSNSFFDFAWNGSKICLPIN